MSNQLMVIASDSCNGEEKQFEEWINVNYPEIETVIENSLHGGLYDIDEETGERTLVEDENYWEKYCSQ